MYFVDRKKITDILEVVEKYRVLLSNIPMKKSQYELLAMERMMTVIVEGILDVGNAMIDGFIMRDPGSYEDIVDILVDERVVVEEEGERLKQVISLRKMLIQDYMYVDYEQLENVWRMNNTSIQIFRNSVELYLERELGVVTAFIPEK